VRRKREQEMARMVIREVRAIYRQQQEEVIVNISNFSIGNEKL
jgi:hypothetical protein